MRQVIHAPMARDPEKDFSAYINHIYMYNFNFIYIKTKNMTYIYQNKLIAFLDTFNFSLSEIDTILMSKKTLPSIKELIFLMLEKEHKRFHTKLINQVSDFYSLSEKGNFLHNRSDFYFAIAERASEIIEPHIYLILFDIKNCYNLSKYETSENIINIYKYITLTTLNTLKKEQSAFSYAFDITNNDDCLLLVGSNKSSQEIKEILDRTKKTIHTRIIPLLKRPKLYETKYLFNFGVTELGKHENIHQYLIELEQTLEENNLIEEKNKVTPPIIIPKNRAIFSKTAANKNSLPIFTSRMDFFSHLKEQGVKDDRLLEKLEKIYFSKDDYSYAQKAIFLYPNILKQKRSNKEGYLLNLKFDNSSGVNKLLLSKEFSLQIIRNFVKLIDISLKSQGLDASIYYIGCNSFNILLDNSLTAQILTNLLEDLYTRIRQEINALTIRDYFPNQAICVHRSLKIGEIPSKRNLSKGISIINCNLTHINKIRDAEDLILFQKQAFTQGKNIKDFIDAIKASKLLS